MSMPHHYRCQCLLISYVILLVLVRWTHTSSAVFIEELDKVNLSTAIHYWQKDLGVMFYAPWCQYCKQFTPYWAEIADHLQSRQTLQLARFNCELPLTDHTEVCQELGVESYPSLYFIGYGNFHQSGSYKSNIVKYKADIYPDAILVWLRMLNTISSYQQKWDHFRSFLPSFLFLFSSSSSSSHKNILSQQHSSLIAEVHELQRQLNTYVQDEEREVSRKIIEEGVDRGDVFPLLGVIDPADEKTAPLRMCAADYALEYCRNEDPLEEPFCGIITQCAQESMMPEACRPGVCPFHNKLGCKLLSNCLDTDVIALFQAAAAAADTKQ